MTREQIDLIKICNLAVDGSCVKTLWGDCPYPNEDEKCGLCFSRYIVEKLGYRLPPKLELIGDEELNSAFDSAFDKPINFDHKPAPDEIITVRLRAVANSQLAADQKAIEEVK